MIPAITQIPLFYKGLAIAAFAVAILAFGWTKGAHHVQDRWDAEKAAQLQAALEREQEHRKKELSWNKRLQEAQNNAIEREKKINEVRASAVSASGSLRNTITSLRGELSRTSESARNQAADTGLQLLGECSEKYREVAEAADRHASDVETLMEAWPKK